MGDEILIMDYLSSSSSFINSSNLQCRICHEEGCSADMEIPCACSGTMKFAHRKCIQRWCDVKGNTTCEICNQTFQPNYSVESKNVAPVTLRDMESRQIPDLQIPGLAEISISVVEFEEASNEECSPPLQGRNSHRWRLFILSVTITLIVRHFLDVFCHGEEQKLSTLLKVYILRLVGILVPLYAIMEAFSAIMQNKKPRDS